MITWGNIFEALPLFSLLVIFGGIGGFVSGLTYHEKRNIWIKGKPQELGFVGDILIGMTTSLGVYFFAGPLLRLEDVNSVSGVLKIISLGILSGVAGMQLLTKMSRQMSLELASLKEEIRQELHDSKELMTQSFEADRLVEKEKYEEAIELYNQVIKKDPLHEHSLIGKAKALRRKKVNCKDEILCQEAIEILKSVIQNNSSSMRAHYNLACYMNISDYDKKEVLDMLKQTFRLSKRYIEQAKDDKDLASLVDTEEFKVLIEEMK